MAQETVSPSMRSNNEGKTGKVTPCFLYLKKAEKPSSSHTILKSHLAHPFTACAMKFTFDVEKTKTCSCGPATKKKIRMGGGFPREITVNAVKENFKVKVKAVEVIRRKKNPTKNKHAAV